MTTDSKINVLLTLEGAKQFQKDLRAVSKSFGTLTRSFDDVGRAAGRVITNLARIGAAATAAAGAAVAAFAEFESDFTNVVTLLDESSFSNQSLQSGIEGLRDGVLELGRESGESFDNLNKGLFDTISAGVGAEDSIEALGVATDLALAGATDTSTAVDGLTSAIGAYGDRAGTAEEIAQKFFTAQKFGKTTIDEIASSFGLVAAQAAASGVGFEELLASVSAATASGVRTQAAFTGARGAIANIVKPTADAQAEAERLGIQFDGAALRSRGLIGVLEDVTQAAGFNEDSFSKLFGSIQGLNFVQAVSNNRFSSANRILAELGDSSQLATTFNAALAAQQDTVAFSARQLQREFQALAIEIGQGLAPAARELLGLFDDILEEFGPDLVAFFQGLGQRVADFTARLREDPQFFIRLETRIKSLLASATNLFQNIIIPGIQGAAQAAGNLAEQLTDIGEQFGISAEQAGNIAISLLLLRELGIADLLSSISLAFIAFGGVARTVLGVTVLPLLKSVANFLKGEFLAAIVSAQLGGFGKLGQAVVGFGATALRALGGVLGLFRTLGGIGALITGAALIGVTAFNALSGSTTPFRDALEQFRFFFANFPAIVSAAFTEVKAFLSGLVESAAAAGNRLLEGFAKIGADIVEFFKELPARVGESISSIVTSAVRSFLELIDKLFGDLINFSDGFLTTVSESIGNFVGLIVETLLTPVALIGEAFGQLITIVSGALSIIGDIVRAGVELLANIFFEVLIEPVIKAFEFLRGIVRSVFGDVEKEQDKAIQKQKELNREAQNFDINAPITDADAALVFGRSGQQIPQFASGGIIRGRGTGTSDSIIARISNGEGIIQAKRVRQYGAGLIHAINKGLLPKFAEGGIVGNSSVTRLSPVPIAANLGPTGRPLTLVLGNGETIEAATMDNDAERKLGRTLRNRNRNKPAARPSWY